jgi:hypothetical protein
MLAGKVPKPELDVFTIVIDVHNIQKLKQWLSRDRFRSAR